MSLRVFRTLKKGYKNKKKVFGFDIETAQIQRDGYIEQDFLMGSIVGDDLVKVFWDKDEMAQYLISSRKLRNSFIMATNLEFDFQHIFQNTKHLEKFFMIDRNGIIYSRYNVDNKNSYQFYDTRNYQPVALSVLADQLKMKKLNYPKCFKRKPNNKQERDELIKYNVNDSYISQQFGEFMIKFCNTMGCKLKITLASTSMDNWRRNYQPFDIFQERRHWLELHYEGAYHGGRTEMFKRGYFGDKDSNNNKTILWYWDYNSHFPACCHDGYDGKGSYPNPSSVHYTNEGTIDHINSYEGISEVTVKAPYMYIPLLGLTSDEGKYIFPTGNLPKSWFTNIELREALRLGYQITKVERCLYYTDSFVPFRDCISDLYEMRMKYKNENNQAMQQMIKTMMNGGIYGKFNQKINNQVNMHSVRNCYTDDYGQLYTVVKNKKRSLQNATIRGDYVFETINTPRKIPIFIQPILGSYTTALARIKLHRDMNKSPKDVVYCDTDSIVTKRPLFETSKRLGGLDLEYKIKEAMFLRPKLYYINTGDNPIFKSKGIGKYISTMTDFNKILNRESILTQRFTKIKESAIRKLPFSSIIDVRKLVGLEDNKRKWFTSFDDRIEQDSKPLVY